MASPSIDPTPASESPLLLAFALLIIVAMVPICLMIAVPGVVTLVAALVTVMGGAAVVAYLLGRVIGGE